MKFRGFEFEDLPWFPDIVRDGMTDYLRFLFSTFQLYQPVMPILKDALLKANTTLILDLCSGSGGVMESIYANLVRNISGDVKIVLSDLFPNLLVYRHLEAKTGGGISFIGHEVDAMHVPPALKGFRTIFSGFHHFDSKKAGKVLKNAVDSNEGIGIFDGGDRNVWMILLIIIFHPLLLFFCSPFFKPFRISRLVFTYLIPLIPLCTVWDGIISILRLYQPEELLRLAKETDGDRYTWISGKVRNRFGMHITYLVGYPAKASIIPGF